MCWTTPGIEVIGTGASMPSRTNTGSTSWPGCTTVSATIRRMAGVVRRRLGPTSRRAGPSGTASTATRPRLLEGRRRHGQRARHPAEPARSDLYERTGRRPYASINFVTCHDGFTLHDLVSYNEKHNEANGEDNRDGANDNHSWNCGAEGPTDDPDIRRPARAAEAEPDRHAAALAGRADAAGRRRAEPHAARQQQHLLPGQRADLARLGARRRAAEVPGVRPQGHAALARAAGAASGGRSSRAGRSAARASRTSRGSARRPGDDRRGLGRRLRQVPRRAAGRRPDRRDGRARRADRRRHAAGRCSTPTTRRSRSRCRRRNPEHVWELLFDTADDDRPARELRGRRASTRCRDRSVAVLPHAPARRSAERGRDVRSRPRRPAQGPAAARHAPPRHRDRRSRELAATAGRRARPRQRRRPHVPGATYRLQFHAGFTFRDAAAIVPYLRRPGRHPLLRLAVSSRPGRAARTATTSSTTAASTPRSAPRTTSTPGRRPARARHGPDPRHRAQPHGRRRRRTRGGTTCWRTARRRPIAGYFDIAWYDSPRPELQRPGAAAGPRRPLRRGAGGRAARARRSTTAAFAVRYCDAPLPGRPADATARSSARPGRAARASSAPTTRPRRVAEHPDTRSRTCRRATETGPGAASPSGGPRTRSIKRRLADLVRERSPGARAPSSARSPRFNGTAGRPGELRPARRAARARRPTGCPSGASRPTRSTTAGSSTSTTWPP